MVTLTFDTDHSYEGGSANGITIPVELSVGISAGVRLLAKLDTGATFCIFQRDYGEQLGLNIEDGRREMVLTARGDPIAIFGHGVTVRSFGHQFDATVYFAADEAFRRNVLGRRGWIEQFRIGLIDYDSRLCLSLYDAL